MPNIFLSKNKEQAINLTFGFALFIATLTMLFSPFSPIMPAADIDSSWVFAMNYAAAEQLKMGKDIIYTFGPYAALFTNTYHPDIYTLYFISSVIFSIGFSIGLLAISIQYSLREKCIVFIVTFISFYFFSRDNLFFSYPLILSILVYNKINKQQLLLPPQKYIDIAIIILSSVITFLPLIKGSFLIICAFVIAASVCVLYLSNLRRLAAIVLIAPCVSMLILWLLSGQDGKQLLVYFISILPIISGYTEAMSVTGWIYEIFLYIALSLVIFWQLLYKKQDTIRFFYIVTAFGIFLFISFKAGFVRHDGHALIAFSALLIATLFLFFISKIDNWRFNKSLVWICLFFFLVMSLKYISQPIWRENFRNKLLEQGIDIESFKGKRALDSIIGLSKSLGLQHTLQLAIDSYPQYNEFKNKPLDIQYIAAKKAINKKCQLEFNMSGTVDIYSYEQSCLLAKDLPWNPRPVFQSYAVYTPKLAIINEQHIRAISSPDNIVFKLQTIDDRFPSLDDGLSWPALFDNYTVGSYKNDWLLLQKKANLRPNSAFTVISQTENKLAHDVFLPTTQKPIFAEITIKPTLIGKVLAILYKPASLYLDVVMTDGSTHSYRVNSTMMETGFFISPLIATTTDFALLAENKLVLTASNVIKSFKLRVINGSQWDWSENYTTQLKEYNY